MNILILGCSFGVPNYYDTHPTGMKKHHTEFLLRDKGHVVHNCSQNAGSNLQTLERANTYLSGLPIVHPAYHQNPPTDQFVDQFIECKNRPFRTMETEFLIEKLVNDKKYKFDRINIVKIVLSLIFVINLYSVISE